MTAIRSTFAVDTGVGLGDRFYNVRWMSKPGTPPNQRWFTIDDVLPDGHDPVWGFGAIDQSGRLIIKYEHPDLFVNGNPPPLWFVLIDMRAYQPAHFVLLGYANDAMPPGTVVEAEEAAVLFNDKFLSSWAGMVNWRSETMMLQQIRTAEQWQRKRIAVTMLLVCDIIDACYGFNPGLVLHGGAITTQQGETLRNIFPGSPGRIDERIGSFTTLDK